MMHDDDIKAPSADEKQLSRVHWFIKSAVDSSGVIVGASDIARLAMGFNNALHADGAMILWEPRFEDTVPRPEGMRP